MENVAVSVVVPVYNTEPYLQQCICSIMEQTLKEIEIICVDDGSSDHSVEVIQRLQKQDGRIQLLQQPNRGGGAARNHGMRHAAGKYLTFLDSDDFFEPDMLEKMFARCEETNAQICVCKARCYHQDLGFYTEEPAAMREEFLPHGEVFSWRDMPSSIFNAFHNWPWNKMFSRAFIEEHGLRFQEIKRTNDLFFTCSALMEAERITTVREVLVSYRVGITGNCQSTNAETPLDFYQAFAALREYLIKNGKLEAVEGSFVNHALDGCIANLNSQENNVKQEWLYHRLKEELFENLGIGNQPETLYHDYNKNMYETYLIIQKEDYPAFLRKRIYDLKQERDYCLKRDYQDKVEIERSVRAEYTTSTSYKCGLALTFIPRNLKEWIKRMHKKTTE